MAFTQFPSILQVKTIDTAEIISLGQFKPKASGELKHIRIRFFKHGTLGVGTQGKCRIHQVNDTSAVFAESNQVAFSAIETALSTTGDWLAWVRFDFDRQNFSNNLLYTISFKFDAYTRNADTFYVGITHDYLFPTYDPASNIDTFSKSTLSFQVFSFQAPPDI